MNEWMKELWQAYRRECLIGIAVLAFCLVAWVAHPVGHHPEPGAVANFSSTSRRASPRPSRGTAIIYVDIKGAVNRPGVYRLGRGSRVQEALKAAGGPTKEADIMQVNLAKEVQDAQVIYVPKHGEHVPTEFGGQSGAESTPPSASGSAPVVNLNSASKDQLQQLTGVGEKKADLIIAYRQAHGGFKSVDELKKVQGFGDKTVAKLKDQLAL